MLPSLVQRPSPSTASPSQASDTPVGSYLGGYPPRAPLVIDPSEIPPAPSDDEACGGQGLEELSSEHALSMASTEVLSSRHNSCTPSIEERSTFVIDPSEIPPAPKDDEESWGQGLEELPSKHTSRCVPGALFWQSTCVKLSMHLQLKKFVPLQSLVLHFFLTFSYNVLIA